MSIPFEKRMNLADGKLLYDNLRTHLNNKIDSSEKGSANGVAELDSTGKILSAQLPSYVDDVQSFNSLSDFPVTGEDGVIYVAKDTNITYRWGGSNYIAIGSDLALGETASTAYRGDRGKIAYDHASAKGSAYASGLYKITTNVEGHVTGATAVQKRDITVLGIPDNADLSDVRDRIGDVVAIQNEEPTEEDTKIWISGTSGTAYQVPTYQEFQEALENLPTGSVEDVQINGTSILDDGVANIPLASEDGTVGVVTIDGGYYGYYGLTLKNGVLRTSPASENNIKGGSLEYRVIDPSKQHQSVFYGLAKAAGADMKNISSTTVGEYPDEQKSAIQSMLGVSNMLAPIEEDASASSQAYAIGQVFAYNGKLYKATSAIALGGIITPGTNCEECNVAGTFVKNTDYADAGKPGIVQIYSAYGIGKSGGYPTTLQISAANDPEAKAGSNMYKPIVPNNQHQSVFYGLAKLAGVDLKDATVTLGAYPAEALTAIQNMLGIHNVEVVRLA